MEPQPTSAPAETTPATKKKAPEPTYNGPTFCDLAGCDDSTRLLVKKKFAGQEKTLEQWTATLAAVGVQAVAVK